jgi:wyosine [tRNA(Phe)-imidazoG37] synthetase (radical SAM superfamily)
VKKVGDFVYTTMKYIYGPVKSRRLGLSLGISLTPYKICTFDCVYCQLGKTQNLTREIKEYANIEGIINELKFWLQNNTQEAKNLNYITLSGSGEPTLNAKIGQLITEIKKITTMPVAVITNSSLLNETSVSQALSVADLIVPSLDAANKEIFEKIDRPHHDINIEDVIKGLINLRKEFRGKIWLEIMLVRGVNDDLRYIKKIKEIIDKINPDKIHLNSPVRATTEPNILPTDKNKLEQIREILGDKAQII